VWGPTSVLRVNVLGPYVRLPNVTAMEAHPHGFAQAALRAEEADLVRRCRSGDEVALRRLIARYRARLVRIAVGLIHDRTEAEDVAQEAFVKAFRDLSRLRDDCAFGGFLYRIIVRLCVDRLRLRRAELTPFDAVVEYGRGTLETRLLVRQLLEELPPELKATLVLREMEGLSYDEVASATGVPVGTVRSRLHAARERFRRLWVSAMKEDQS